MSKTVIQKVLTYTGHKQAIYALDYNPLTKGFCTSGADGMVTEWKPGSDDPGKVLMTLNSACYCLTYWDENTLLVAENGFGVHVVNLKEKVLKNSISLPGRLFFAIQKVHDHFYISNDQGEVFKGQPHNNEAVTRYKLSNFGIRSMHYQSDWKKIAMGSSGGEIIVFEPETGKSNRFQAHDKSVFAVSKLKGQDWLISAGKDALIKIWSISKEYRNAGEIPAHIYGINYLEISPDQKLFLTCSMDKTIKVWSTLEGKLLKVIDFQRYKGHFSSVNKVKWISNDEFISISDDRKIIQWKLEFEKQ